jgi:hypothetical protein
MQNHPPAAPTRNHLQLLPELQFLIACCRAEPTGDDIDLINTMLVGGAFEPNTLLKLAGSHGVIPVVYKTLKHLADANLLNAPEADLLASFKNAYLQIARRNMLMTAELLRVVKRLGANGIGALAFKGPALARQAYGDITLRQFGDLDILIRKELAPRAISLLEEDGYVTEIALRGNKKRAFCASVNVIGMEKASNSVRLEVHWELLSKNYAIAWNKDALWSHARNVVINGKEVPLLSPEYHLLYLCIHGAKHLYGRLEWISDVDRTVRANPGLDWKFFFSEAEEMGVLRMVLMSLWLCRELLTLHLSEDVNSNIDRDKPAGELGRRIAAMLSGKTQSAKAYGTFGMLWRMRERPSDRIRFALYGLFAPKFDDFKFLALPKPLLFLYPAVRIVRLTAKYFRR